MGGTLYQGACGGQVDNDAQLARTSADERGGGLAPLSQAAVPQPVGGDVINHAAAVRLGKALFWDAQVGSDGVQSCASCHYQAGTDSRRFNVIHPGPNGMFESAGVTGPGMWFTLAPITTDDRVGSEGVMGGIFRSISKPPSAVDQCDPDPQAPWWMTSRRVTGRQAPSAIGAVFNRQNFWDGRANHVFNGQNPFGGTANSNLAPQGGSVLTDSHGGGGGEGGGGGGGGKGGGARNIVNASVASAAVEAANGSLASQAVGPALSGTEMSCAGRAFNGPNSLGTKMLGLKPLALQKVSKTDSTLGALSAEPMNGLTTTYAQMISEAFGPAMAASAEAQFSSIFGQAVQAYESTLIPDKTPLDKFLAGNSAALTANQQRGLDRFTGKAGCIQCHAGPELTDASVSFAASRGLTNEDGGDQGFHNLGVRPTAEDLGRAGLGPQGMPFAENGSPMNRGAFKTAGLRNVGLTAPYFHNGVKPTLAAVVDFYNRGGDFANPERAKRIKPLGLDAGDQAALVDFLQNGLTDCRVAMHAAPFDHPSLAVANGPSLEAVGKAGYGPCK